MNEKVCLFYVLLLKAFILPNLHNLHNTYPAATLFLSALLTLNFCLTNGRSRLWRVSYMIHWTEAYFTLTLFWFSSDMNKVTIGRLFFPFVLEGTRRWFGSLRSKTRAHLAHIWVFMWFFSFLMASGLLRMWMLCYYILDPLFPPSFV